MRVRLKVCCIASVEEAALAVRLGADALGLVSSMPSGPGVIDDALIPGIAGSAPPGVATFLLTSRTGGEAIADHLAHARVGVAQLVDAVEPGAYAVIRARLPLVRIVQVLHVWDDSASKKLAPAPSMSMLCSSTRAARAQQMAP
jgi:phosphoribosylanthranilate isomerase